MATRTGYEFAVCEPKHRDEIVDLLTPLWGPDRDLREAYFNWKYGANPYVRNPLIYLALHEGRVVGTNAYAVNCWKAGTGQERYLSLHGADSVVSPEHRRRGLHYEMQLAAYADMKDGPYHAVITMAANAFTTESHAKSGSKSVAELESLYWRPGRNVNRFRRFARRLPLIPSLYHLFCRYRSPQPPPEISSRPFGVLDANYEQGRFRRVHIVLKDSPEPKTMEALVNRNTGDSRITQVRDEPFFTWRYMNPLSRFRFIFWEEAGLQGYLVLQQPLHGRGDSVFVVDWEAANTSILSEMLGAVINHGGFRSVGLWSVTIPDDTLKVLRENGFSPIDESLSAETGAFCPHLMVVPLNTNDGYTMGGRNLLDIAEWDLRPIFADSY